MPNQTKHAAQLEKLRQLSRPRLKVAALGGSEDAPFEQQFSNIAHAYLKDKAPGLLDYEVGFQLIDRNQENTKAIGVFGFKVGSQWLYAPVFFLNGDLKGHELLYIKNQDLFVPMKENWLNYILNRKPNVLGTEVGRNLRDIGVHPPALSQLSRSPQKYASALKNMPEWAQDATTTIAYLGTTNPGKDPKYKDLVDLPTFLQKEGAVVIKSLIFGFKENPKLASVFDQFHGMKVIDEAIGELKKWEDYKRSNSVVKEAKCINTPSGPRCFKDVQKKAPKKSVMPDENTVVNTEPGDLLKASVGEPLDKAITYAGQKDLDIYVYDEILRHGTGMENLTDKDREKLIKDKVLIKDKRKETQTAYEVTSPVQLQNPHETGLYDVLVKSNKFEKCLVIFGPYSNRGRKDFVTVVRVGDGDSKAWLNIHPAHIWTGKQYNKDEYKEWWNKLPDADGLSVSRQGLCLLIGNTGEGTLPFKTDSDVGGEGQKIYEVYFKSWADKERPGNLPTIARPDKPYDSYGYSYCNRIQFTGKRGASLRAVGDDLYVPGDYKKLQLRPAEEPKKDDDDPCCCSEMLRSESDPPPILPGNQLDVDLMLGTKTAAMKIYDLGNEVDINGVRMQKLAALIHLVRNVGLREKQARVLLERARMSKTARFRVIKKAEQSYDLQKSGPGAPPIPETPTGYDPMTGGNYPTQSMSEHNIPIPELSASMTDRSVYSPLDNGPTYGPDHGAQQAAMQAAQTGQKEVFDTAMIGSLLKAVRDDNMVDKYMGDLMKGLDRLGRILFLFYWHGEKFEDRYGKGDMVELEDGLRNAFEYLGDLVLFLKQRSVDPHDEGNSSGPDLSGISG